MAETKRTEGGFAFAEGPETELTVGLGKVNGGGAAAWKSEGSSKAKSRISMAPSNPDLLPVGGGRPSEKALANS